MKFTLVPNGAPAQQAADDYAGRHPQGSAYHLQAWRQAVADAYGYPGQVLLAHDAAGAIVGMLPLCVVALPLGRPRWVSLPFCDLGGPLADTPELAAQLTAEAQRRIAAQGVRKLELRCSAPQSGGDDAALAGRKVRMLLDLPASAEALIASYPPKLRSQIRKAEKNGLDFSLGAGPDAVAGFYDVYSRNMRRLGSPPHSRAWFDAVLRSYGADAVIGLVKLGREVVGAGLVLRCGPRAVIPWASTLAEHNRLAPNMLLYWGLQAHLCDSGASQFDFGRSTFDEGTYKFKKQWGAQPWALDWQHWTAQGMAPPAPPAPAAAADADKPRSARAMVEAVWQKLPLSLTNSLGPRLRRYITL